MSQPGTYAWSIENAQWRRLGSGEITVAPCTTGESVPVGA